MSLRTVLFSVLLIFLIAPAFAQVATAPYSPDQRLLNPAVAGLRAFRGYSFALDRDDETKKPAEDTSLKVGTVIDTLSANLQITRQPYFYELSLLPQQGTRTIKSEFVDGTGAINNSNSSRKLMLVPIKGIAATRAGNWGSVGAGALYTHSDFSVNDQYAYKNGNNISENEATGKRSVDFLSAAFGGVLTIPNTGFSFGLSTELIHIANKEDSVTTNSSTSSTTTSTTKKTKNSTDKTDFKKTLMGIGYVTKFGGSNSIRVDLSRETMPTLDLAAASNGQIDRLTVEGTWSFVQAGMELRNTSGYNVDPYNLIPYFLSLNGFSDKAVLEYSFFGGFRTAKGHSFGASYSNSSVTQPEALNGPTQPSIDMVTSNLSFGLSYMFVY